MANARSSGKKRDTSRDSGGFAAIPWSVLDSYAYKGLTVAAKALMLEVARQYHRDDNGRMLLSLSHLRKRGWYSAGTIQKAKQELIEAGLIFETVKGCRPNKASWYAATWWSLDKLPGYDLDAERLFIRAAYRLTPAKPKRTAPTCKNPKKNAVLTPPHGIEKAPIVPPHGIETTSFVPPHGTIRPLFDSSSIPPHGHPLEMPSAGVRSGEGTDPVATPPAAVEAAPSRLGSKTTIPEDFGISDDVEAWAKSKGIDRLKEHLEAFKLKAISRGYLTSDWDAAFKRAALEGWAKLRKDVVPSAAATKACGHCAVPLTGGKHEPERAGA